MKKKTKAAKILTGAVSGPRVYHSWHLALDGKVLISGVAYSERLAQLTMRAHAKAYAKKKNARIGTLTWGRINQPK